jgi:transcription antitermination factor NusA-like protein
MSICKVCLQSDMLCGACARKVESGAIKKIDVDLSRAVYKLSKESGHDIEFLHAIEGRDRLFVIVESKYAGRFIGPGGRTIKKLSEMIGKQIKLLEKAEGSDKEVIEKMLCVPVVGINKIYTQDGEALKVRIDGKYRRNTETVVPLLGKILNKKISVVFE